MGLEIERKFKLQSPAILDGLQGQSFLQAYLAKGAVLLRVRVTGDRAWLTLKGQPLSSLSRPEWEYDIPVADAREMARQPGAYALEKTRYCVEHAGHTFEVDCYHGGIQWKSRSTPSRPWSICPTGSAKKSPATKPGTTKAWPATVGRIRPKAGEPSISTPRRADKPHRR